VILAKNSENFKPEMVAGFFREFCIGGNGALSLKTD
jgi:hypothetical protein